MHTLAVNTGSTIRAITGGRMSPSALHAAHQDIGNGATGATPAFKVSRTRANGPRRLSPRGARISRPPDSCLPRKPFGLEPSVRVLNRVPINCLPSWPFGLEPSDEINADRSGCCMPSKPCGLEPRAQSVVSIQPLHRKTRW